MDSAKAALNTAVPGSEAHRAAERHLAHLNSCNGFWLLAPALAHMRISASYYRVYIRRYLRLPQPICNYGGGVGSTRLRRPQPLGVVLTPPTPPPRAAKSFSAMSLRQRARRPIKARRVAGWHFTCSMDNCRPIASVTTIFWPQRRAACLTSSLTARWHMLKWENTATSITNRCQLMC